MGPPWQGVLGTELWIYEIYHFFISSVHYANNSIKYKFTCIFVLKIFLLTKKKTSVLSNWKNLFVFISTKSPAHSSTKSMAYLHPGVL